MIVQAVGVNDDGTEDYRQVYTMQTDVEGDFTFDNLPSTHDYKVRIHGESDFIYFLNSSGFEEIFDLSKPMNTRENLSIKIPRTSRGTWSQITYTDGLTSNYSMSSIIDDENKFWFGTYTGISIYDGQEINNITQYDGLPQKPVLNLFKDNDNTIWAAVGDPFWTNTGGLIKFKNEKIEKVFNKADGFNFNNVRAITQDINNRLLVVGNAGLSVYENNTFKTFSAKDGIPFGYVNAIMVEGSNIWLGTLDGLVLYNGKKFNVYNRDDGLIHQWIRCIKKGPKGNIWIGTRGGISIFDGTKFNNINRLQGLPNREVNDIYFDDSGEALISTQGGVYRYNGKTFVRLNPRMAGHDFGLRNVQQINRSSDGIYWFNDWSGAGIVKYDPRSILNTTDADSFPKTQIHDIEVDKNRNLWFGTANHGLIKVSDSKIIKQIKREDGLRSNEIFALDFDIYGNVWMATQNALSKYDGREVKNFTTENGLPLNNIRDLVTDDRGYVWLASQSGITRFDGLEAKTYGENAGLTPQRSTTIGFNIAKGGPDDIIVLSIYNYGFSVLKNERFTNYGVNEGLPDPRISSVDIDSEGNIWLGSDGSGVIKFDGLTFKQYKREDGVANPEIWNIHIDDYDRVWIGTYGGGVGFYDGETWNTLDKRDGIVDNDISSLTSFGGNVYWFGSGIGSGFSEYRPSKSPGFSIVKEVLTSSERYDLKGKNIIPKSVTGNRLSFKVNAANYNTHKDKQKFRYRIKEVAESWSEPSSNSVYEWVPKKSGLYTFEVQSIDRDLNYSNPAKVTFDIAYPWYREPITAIPFWGLIVFIISISGISTNKYFKQRI